MISQKEKNIVRALNQRRHQDISLFGDTETSYYWKLSDLTILYNHFFNIKDPVSLGVVTNINGHVFKSIPNFRNLISQPVHILNFTDKNFNAFSNESYDIKIISNGTNQKLSPVACEYLFGQFTGTEFEQAYFMCLNQPIEKIKEVSNLLKFNKVREQVKRSSDTLASLIKRSTESRLDSYSEVWSFLWCRLFDMRTMDDLRTRYQIKEYETIMNYMQLKPLIFVNGLLQEIIQGICNRSKPNKQEIKDIILRTISDSRVYYFKCNFTSPENYTTKNTENSIIGQIQKAQKSFWQLYYPVSLQQR